MRASVLFRSELKLSKVPSARLANLVIAAEGSDKHDGRDVLEAVNPLAALGSLPTDIEYPDPMQA
eukprot:198823-Amorphochlora_amoeboformis.AAC.1